MNRDAQITKKNSLDKTPQPKTRSALLMNLSAAANSKKPKMILKETIQFPDRGSFFMVDGNNASKKNGIENAKLYPNIPIIG